MKLSKLHKTKYDDNSSNDDSEDDDVMNDEEAHIQLENVKGLTCGVNRIKSMNSQPIGKDIYC
jgi:ribosome assembly protein RRB1